MQKTISNSFAVNIVRDGANGTDGKNAVRLDLDNEMDMVPTDSTGKITADRTVETVARLYDGSKEVDISGATLSVSGGPASSIATQSSAASGRGKKLSWTFKKDQVMSDGYRISIAYTYNGVDYSATFTVAASKGQAVWQLKPSQSSIVYSRQRDNTLESADNTLNLSVVKIDGASSSELTPSASGQTIRYSTSSMPISATAGSAWPGSNSLTVVSTFDNVYIAMFNASGTLLDRETIPVVCDGSNGDDAVTYDIVFAEAWAKATPEGVISARLRGNAYRIEGSTRTPIANATIRYGYNTQNSNTYASTTADNYGYFTEDYWFDGDALDNYAQGSAVVFVSIIVGGSAVCTKHVTIVQEAAKGTKGNPGHVGRWYYYAGEWQSGVSYTMQETQAPFVKRRATINGVTKDYFFMLDYGTSGNSTGTTTLDPASNYNPVSGQGTKPWTLMQSEMQYYIAKAFFGEYAQFGSFIINGDWMLSTNGTLNGGTYNGGAYYSGVNAYTYFDPEYPLGTRNLGISASGITGTTRTQRGAAFTLKGRRLVKVTGRVNTSGATLNVALYNASSSMISSVQTITSTSDTSLVFTFNSDNDTSVHIKAWMSSSTSSQMGYITSATVETFAPNFAVDGLTGKSIQNNAVVRGEINATSGVFKDVLGYGGFRSPFTYVGPGEAFSIGTSDNMAVYSSGGTIFNQQSYDIPWDASQSGRRIVVTNFQWKGNGMNTYGYMSINAPSGKFFYEDGRSKSVLKLSREAVELLGYGDEDTFYGWIVMKRTDLMTEHAYGHPQTVLAKLIVTGGTSPTCVGTTFKGTTVSVTRSAQGKYLLSGLDIKLSSLSDLFVIATGKGLVNGSPVAACFAGVTNGAVEIDTFTTAGLVDGNFSVMLMNVKDVEHL